METHNIQGVEMTQYISDELSLTLLLSTLCFILSTYLLIKYIFALASETYRWLTSKYKGEAYIFHFPNPLIAIKNCSIRTKNWFSAKIKQIKIALQAIKDVVWFINQMKNKDEKTKHTFIAFFLMSFFYGVFSSFVFDIILKIDLIQMITNLVKAI